MCLAEEQVCTIPGDDSNGVHSRIVNVSRIRDTQWSATKRDPPQKPKETYRTNPTKQTTSNVFCTSKKRKNPKSSSKNLNTKIFSNYFENYFENFYKYILVHFLFENLDFGKSTRTNS